MKHNTIALLSKKNGVMRFLTLLCFLHFSGFNNGYAYYLTAAAPLDLKGSLFQVDSTVKVCHQLVNVLGVSDFRESLLGINRISVMIEAKVRSLVSGGRRPVGSLSPEALFRSLWNPGRSSGAS